MCQGSRRGEYFGRNRSLAPVSRIARRTALPRWLTGLSTIATSPGLKAQARSYEAVLTAIGLAHRQV